MNNFLQRVLRKAYSIFLEDMHGGKPIGPIDC